MIRPHVVRLLDASRPAHVSWFVITVCVDAFDFVARRRTRSNIKEKTDEVVAPLSMDSYATRSVVFVFVVVGVVATLLYSQPGKVFGAVAQPVSAKILRRDLSMPTSTRMRLTVHEMIVPNIFSCSAFTTAQPHFSLPVVPRITNYAPASEREPREIAHKQFYHVVVGKSWGESLDYGAAVKKEW